MAAFDNQTAATALAGAALAFGAVGVIAPQAVIGAYGLPDTAPFRFVTRLWATRTAALGAILVTTDRSRRRPLYVAAAIMNLADVNVAINAGPDLSRRTKLMATATSAVFAVASGALAAGVLP